EGVDVLRIDFEDLRVVGQRFAEPGSEVLAGIRFAEGGAEEVSLLALGIGGDRLVGELEGLVVFAVLPCRGGLDQPVVRRLGGTGADDKKRRDDHRSDHPSEHDTSFHAGRIASAASWSKRISHSIFWTLRQNDSSSPPSRTASSQRSTKANGSHDRWSPRN